MNSRPDNIEILYSYIEQFLSNREKYHDANAKDAFIQSDCPIRSKFNILKSFYSPHDPEFNFDLYFELLSETFNKFTEFQQFQEYYEWISNLISYGLPRSHVAKFILHDVDGICSDKSFCGMLSSKFPEESAYMFFELKKKGFNPFYGLNRSLMATPILKYLMTLPDHKKYRELENIIYDFDSQNNFRFLFVENRVNENGVQPLKSTYKGSIKLEIISIKQRHKRKNLDFWSSKLNIKPEHLQEGLEDTYVLFKDSSKPSSTKYGYMKMFPLQRRFHSSMDSNWDEEEKQLVDVPFWMQL